MDSILLQFQEKAYYLRLKLLDGGNYLRKFDIYYSYTANFIKCG